MQYAEQAKLICFDGGRFTELWASATAMPDAQYVIERGGVKIHYLATNDGVSAGASPGETVVSIHLSPAGAIASKSK